MRRASGHERRQFHIKLGKDKKSVIHVRRTFLKNSLAILSISIEGNPEDFVGSCGLLGAYPTGNALGRDGRDMEGDWNAYGMEWQVGPDEPKLFRDKNREPQLPEAQCKMPTVSITSEIVHALKMEYPQLYMEAQVACRNAKNALNDCMADVMVAKDTSAAEAFVY